MSDYSRLGLWANSIGANVDVECFFCIERKTERGTAKVFGKEKRLESLVQVYIDDIHVIDIFFVGHTM